MTDKLKSIINAELTMLPYKFFDLEQAHKMKDSIESSYGIKTKHLFSYQGRIDNMKPKRNATEFKAACALYFEQFLDSDGFNVKALERELSDYGKTMERHLGKAWDAHLKFILKLHKELNQKTESPRGLLKRAI